MDKIITVTFYSDSRHSISAEARKLSEELREAQLLLERKDFEIAELQTIVGSSVSAEGH